MKTLDTRPPAITLGCATAAVAVAGALLGGLFDLFDGRAEQQRWLQPTPAALHLAAQCDARRDRRQRSECLGAALATLRAQEQRGTRLAQR